MKTNERKILVETIKFRNFVENKVWERVKKLMKHE